MVRKSKPNHDYVYTEEYKERVQAYWINQARLKVNHLAARHFFGYSFSKYSFIDEKKKSAQRYSIHIENIYKEGRLNKQIFISFSDFVGRVFYLDVYTCWRPLGGKYRKNVDHKKKDGKKSDKEAWRLEKGIAKDKAKAYYRYSYRGWAKKHSNRQRRSYFRQQLALGNYESFDSRVDYVEFRDPWLWD